MYTINLIVMLQLNTLNNLRIINGQMYAIILPAPLKNSRMDTSKKYGMKGLSPIENNNITIPISIVGFRPHLIKYEIL